jgi:hypothetical protein
LSGGNCHVGVGLVNRDKERKMRKTCNRDLLELGRLLQRLAEPVGGLVEKLHAADNPPTRENQLKAKAWGSGLSLFVSLLGAIAQSSSGCDLPAPARQRLPARRTGSRR